jgi:hypothetical protein
LIPAPRSLIPSLQSRNHFDDDDNYYQGRERDGIELVSLDFDIWERFVKGFEKRNERDEDVKNGLKQITDHDDIAASFRPVNSEKGRGKSDQPEQKVN